MPCQSICECVCVASFAYTSIFAQQMVLSLSCFAWCVPASLADTEGERLLCFFLNLHPNMCPSVTHLPTVSLSITCNSLYVVSVLNVNTGQTIEDLFLVGLYIYTTVKCLKSFILHLHLYKHYMYVISYD